MNDKLLEAAYLLLCDFQVTIEQSLEGDHPSAEAVGRWLDTYEKRNNLSANIDSAIIEGVPV